MRLCGEGAIAREQRNMDERRKLRAAAADVARSRASSDSCRDRRRHRARGARRSGGSAARSSLAVCGPNIMASAQPAIDPLLERVGGIGPKHGDGVAGAGLDAQEGKSVRRGRTSAAHAAVFLEQLRQLPVDRGVGDGKDVAGHSISSRQDGAAASAARPAAGSDCRARRETGRSR